MHNELRLDMETERKAKQKYLLDDTKLKWHQDRVRAWMRGVHIAPITIDMALTRACNYACKYCYSKLQENKRETITPEIACRFAEDAHSVGVKGIALMSDGESTLSPAYQPFIETASDLGIDVGNATHGYNFTPKLLDAVLPRLTWIRFNISAGEPDAYARLMGVPADRFHRVLDNLKYAIQIKKDRGLSCTIGIQMVLMPKENADQIIPFAKLGKNFRPDYAVIKHCSDNNTGELGIVQGDYTHLDEVLREAERYADPEYQVSVKWSKLRDGRTRVYRHCWAAPFFMQVSGSGLIAACAMLFEEKFKDRFHIANICKTRLTDILKSDWYWEVMDYLASSEFDVNEVCGSCCNQHLPNKWLEGVKQGLIQLPFDPGPEPQHVNFI